LSPNPPKRAATASFAITVFAIIMIFLPESIGIDGFNGGFAISFISIFVAATALVVGIMYLGLASKVDNILQGRGVLAHWFYTPEFWLEFTGEEYEMEKSEKKGLFLIVTGFALFFGVLFWILDEEAGFYVFLVMLGLIGLCAFAWRFSAWSNYRQNRGGGVKEVYITKDAVFLNGKLTAWNAWFSHFDDVTLEYHKRMPLLVFKYTGTSGRAGPQTYLTRVPIPPGQEVAAQYVIEQVKTQN
jgi:hypothetical protein